MYGLLAEDVAVAHDRLSATFRLNPAARFNSGKPVLAADVKFSFDCLNGKLSHPAYRAMFADVKDAVVLGERAVQFHFRRPSAELPLIVGSMPVFSRDWGAGKPFDQIIDDIPIGSGPYRVGHVDFGRDITYQRDPRLLGRATSTCARACSTSTGSPTRSTRTPPPRPRPSRPGSSTTSRCSPPGSGPRPTPARSSPTGELVKRNMPSSNAGDFQGFVINTRRPQFADVRVRQALELGLDFEWMNREFFYNSYTRVRGYFNASDFEAKGLPGADELAVLAPLRAKLPPEVFTQPVPLPPSTDPPGSLRDNLRQAQRLLEEAGWTYRDGALRNAAGEPFTIEFLDSEGSMGRIVTPYMQELAKLGIDCSYRVADFALLQKRLDVFDFDITSIRERGQRGAGQRTEGPVHLRLGRQRGFGQPHGHPGSGRGRPGGRGHRRHHPARAGGPAAGPGPGAALRPLLRAGLVRQLLPHHLPGRQVRASPRCPPALPGRRLDHLHLVGPPPP